MVKRLSLVLAALLVFVSTQADAFTLLGRRTGFLGNDIYTKQLFHFDGADASKVIADSSASKRDGTANFDAQVDTAQYKFGYASLLLDGTGAFVTVADHDDFNFGTGSFTIDTWVRINALPSEGASATLVSQYASGTSFWRLHFLMGAGGTARIKLEYQTTSYADDIQSDVIEPGGAWMHVAASYDEATGYFDIYLNGSRVCHSQGTYSGVSHMPDVAANLVIGAHNGGSLLNGWMDELRISKGIARWTANFTPPTAAYR